jgi:acyl carrier protein
MRLHQIVANVLKVDATMLDAESNATNTKNWDSLRHIEVIFAVESAYHVRFSMPEITSLRNLGDIRRLLVAKGASCDSEVPTRKIAETTAA